MKKLLFTLLCALFVAPSFAQEMAIYTRVAAVNPQTEVTDSQEPYSVNVYESANPNSAVVGQLLESFHGYAPGVVLQRGYAWTKVKVDDVVGYVKSSEVELHYWFYGEGAKVIVTYSRIPIYGEDYSGENGLPIIGYIEKNTIITDEFISAGEYYVLPTAHDNYYVKKKDVKIAYRKNLKY